MLRRAGHTEDSSTVESTRPSLPHLKIKKQFGQAVWLSYEEGL